MDCADFDTLDEALAWHKEHPEDGLDADNDGRVCEAQFPGQEPAQDRDSEVGDKDCADFDTLDEALAWHKDHPEDGLDADNDGRVCEAQFPDQKPSRDKDEEDEDRVRVPTKIPAGL